jgi:putative Mg2+ transporter-C (MgtC) family protein
VSEAEALLRLALAALFGALLGLERAGQDKPAGVRTFSIVALGAALFSTLSIMTFGEGDAGSRIPAQIVTGVGFLGAGVIIQQRGGVVGLTTAAGIWAAAAVGMGLGFGLYVLSGGGIAILLILLRIVGRLPTDERQVRRNADVAAWPSVAERPGRRSATRNHPSGVSAHRQSSDADGNEPDPGARPPHTEGGTTS